MRVVLDTNILVRANPKAAGVARAVLAEFISSTHQTLITSPFILEETARVLSYPRVQALWPQTQEEVQDYIAALADISELVCPTSGRRVVRADPQDDPVVETALVGHADCLCTLDRHFYSGEVLVFLAENSVQVLSDVKLLDLFRRHRAGE